MQNLFSWDSPIMRWVSRASDIVIVSLLYLLCSIPIFTIGASTAALYAVILRRTKEDSSPVIQAFFHAFRKKFKQATIIWIMTVPLIVLSILNALIGFSGIAGESVFQTAACFAPGILLVMVLGFLYPLIAYFDVSNLQAIKNAVLLCIAKLPRTLGIGVINCIPIAFFLLFPLQFFYSAIWFILFGPGIQAIINTYLLLPVFTAFPNGFAEK